MIGLLQVEESMLFVLWPGNMGKVNTVYKYCIYTHCILYTSTVYTPTEQYSGGILQTTLLENYISKIPMVNFFIWLTWSCKLYQ